MKLIILLGAVLTGYMSMGQVQVSFRALNFPGKQKGDTVYVAGSFNNWNPHDLNAALYPGNQYQRKMALKTGNFEMKCTRGSWQAVEVKKNGAGIENRKFMVEKDTMVDINIENWADAFPHEEKKSTASSNVHIMSAAFYMPQLNRNRRVWIYLPPGYETGNKTYPVLYMQDGQNVFDNVTSFSGEWGVDETLDAMGESNACIVVAVDHGNEKRINEYSPVDMEKYGKGEGDAYVRFLVETLKPYVDKHYRTKKTAANTFIAGSSMGGLISFYAQLKYPAVFGGSGVFSPAFWIAPELKKLVPKLAPSVKGKIYFYAGEQENERMVPDMLEVFQLMNQYSKAKMTTIVRAEGNHSEAKWSAEFPLFFQWIMKK